MTKRHRGRQASSNDADAPFTLSSPDEMGTRVLRLSHLLFEELYRLFRFEVSDPALAEVFPTSLSLICVIKYFHSALLVICYKKYTYFICSTQVVLLRA